MEDPAEEALHMKIIIKTLSRDLTRVIAILF